MTLCKCKCGREVKKGNRYISGHNKRKHPPINPNIIKYCKCKCGEQIKIKKHHNKFNIPNYINGHYWKGRLKSKEHIINLSKSNSGKKRSCEVKKKQRITNIKLHAKKQEKICPSKKILEELYKTKTLSEINKLFYGVFIPKLFKKYNIKKRLHSETQKMIHNKLEVRELKSKVSTGKNNSMWKDGRSFELYPSEFNETLKNKIRKRDNYACQLCFKTKKENNNNSLCVHHIDYNKKNNNLKNLLSLCNSCHARTNDKRKYWQNLFNIKR